MADDAQRKSSNEYSGSQAPAVRAEAEERRNNYSDMRLIPGGAHAAPTDPGMSGLDRGTVPSQAIQDELVDYTTTAEQPGAPKVSH